MIIFHENMQDSEGATVELLSKAAGAIRGHDFEQARELLRRVSGLGRPIQNHMLLLGVLLLTLGHRLRALQALRKELASFPLNETAAAYLQQLLQCSEPSHPAAPPISVVIYPSGAVPEMEDLLHSLFDQHYPSLECLWLNQNQILYSDTPFKDYEPNLRVIDCSGLSRTAAIERGLANAAGEVLCVACGGDVFCDRSLFRVGEVFSGNHEIDFLTGERFYYNDLGEPNYSHCFRQRWQRSLFLDPDILRPPYLLLTFTGTFWRRSLWQSDGMWLDPQCRHAPDYELFSRYFRRARLCTLAGRLAGRLRCENEEPSLGYIADCVSVMARERAVRIDPSLSRPAPLISAEAIPEKSKPPAPFKISPARRAAVLAGPMKISVVTPSFNQGAFLEECICSVLSQQWPNLEYVIIDGGSSDNSIEIIKRYEKHLHYWHSRPDAGQYAAVHEGFQHTSGEIMTWINSDDRFYFDAFSNAAAVFGCLEQVRWLTGTPAQIQPDGNITIHPAAITFARTDYLNKAERSPWIQQEGTFWRRELWEAAGGGLDLRYELAGDFELWLRFFRHARVHTLDHPLALFRIQPDQRSSLFFYRYLREMETIKRREKEALGEGRWTTLEPAPPPILVSDLDSSGDLNTKAGATKCHS